MIKNGLARGPALAFVFILATFPPLGPAQAYVGPGLSAGAMAVVLGVIGSVFLALFAIVWYPLKRLLKKSKPAADSAEGDSQRA